MASAAADVIALQEVERNWWRTAMDDQPALIERLLPDRFWSFAPELDVDASLREPSGRVINRRRQHGQMVLSRWPILSSRMLILPKLEIGPVFNFVTGVLETVIAPPAGPLRIYNVHLGYAAAAERRLQVEALIEFIKNGGDYSAASPGAPIAYKLSYLRDNSPARMSFTTDYSVKECARVSQKVRVTLKSITVESAGGDSGDDLELYGAISVQGTSTATLFSKTSSTYVTIHEGATFPNGGIYSEAVIDVTPSAGSKIRINANIWDADGFINGDDLIGNEFVLNPFETGWRREQTMFLTGSDSQVKFVFGLEPI